MSAALGTRAAPAPMCHRRPARTVAVRAARDGHSFELDRRELLAGAALGLSSLPLLSGGAAAASVASVPASVHSVYDLSATLAGEPFPLSQLKGKATVFVNVASQ